MASTNRDEISRLELLHAAHPDGLVFPHLADAYRRAGRYAQAESLLTAGLRRHADFSSAHLVLARLRLDQGKREEAATAFRRVLQLDPRNMVALEFLGRIAAEDDRPADALQYFRRLYELKPKERIAEQIRGLERDLRSDAAPTGRPEGPEAGGNGGSGDPSDRRGGSPEPGEVVTETMAELYARQGLYGRAVAVYRQLLERKPGDTRLRAKLEAAESRREPDERAGDVGPAPVERPVTGRSTSPAVGEPATIREGLRTLLAWRPRPDGAAAPDARRSHDHVAEPWAEAAVSEPAAPPPARPWREATVPPPPRSERGPGERPAARPAGHGLPGGTAGMGQGATPPRDRLTPRRAPVALPGEREEGQASGAMEIADAQARSLIALTDLLVGLLEYRDPFFRGGSSLTRLLATYVAEEMGLSRAERVNLALAAVLRDLGRLAMGGRLVSARRFGPTSEDRRKIERHVDLALQLMEGIELPDEVRAAVRHHHERWDGGGYPDGLAGKQIPLLARILAVVDSFAAMVSPRPYRLPRKVPEAERELRDAAGSQFDPEPVAALQRVLKRRDQPHLGFVQRHHVLLVNPDQPGALVTGTKLCSAGYLAEVASRPRAARERLRRVPVAALVMSARVGEEDAVGLVRGLRADPSFSALPIVVTEAESVALRVRLLESGADVCFPPGVSYGELEGTLGALVRRTIRSRATTTPASVADEAPWLALQGDVEDFPLSWLLQVMKYDSRTAAIGIRTDTEHGAIYLENGDAVHAQIRGGIKGEDALRRMLQWRKGRFTVQPDARPRERTIETSIMHLLLNQAVETDHVEAGIFGAVSPDT